MTDTTTPSIVERLEAEEARMRTLYDYVCTLRDKQETPSGAFTDLNQVKHAISGRDPVLEPAAATIRELAEALHSLMTEIETLMSESSGVAGLHLNGDDATWDELTDGGRFEGWLHLERHRALLSRLNLEGE